MVGTGFGELCSCCCLPLLPQPACSILPTTYQPLVPPLYFIRMMNLMIWSMNGKCKKSDFFPKMCAQEPLIGISHSGYGGESETKPGYRGEAKPANLEAKPPPYWQSTFAAAAAAAATTTTSMVPTPIATAVSSHSDTQLVDAIKTDASSSPVPLVPATAYYITEPPAPEHNAEHPEPAIICGN